MLRQKRLLIAVGGGIAAYKVCELVSQLFQAEVEVRVMLSQTATEFITPLTLSTLSRHRVYRDRDFWNPIAPKPLHIELGEWSQLLTIAPLTANTMAKLAHGIADNLITNTVLASRCPVLLAPAMNTDMWEQIPVQKNWQILQENPRYHTIGPASGLLACDRVGAGRMAEPKEIVQSIESLFHTSGKRDLNGKNVLISAGGTREYLDPVRFIGNPATGKMGLALARAAMHRGASVTLVCGPTEIELPKSLANIRIITAVSAAQMEREMLSAFDRADLVVMSAAVADVKPAQYFSSKLSKKDLPSQLSLEPVPDILKKLSDRKRDGQILIGFAAQTGDIVKPAKEKLKNKRLDAIFANPIDLPGAGFSSDSNQGMLIDRNGRIEAVELNTKLALAHRIFNFIADI
ncbi:MAG: bifunctional phosphopantothenoylcysteine decarboxylase/phosphopantothenate--cysteine ligase CoaBC [Prochloraceae cyanobacterium]